MAFEKFKKFIGDGEEETKVSDNGSNNEYYEASAFKDVAGNSKMILLEPRAFSEAQQIVDYLKKRSSVVVNMKRVTPDKAKRIVDFLSGAIYAIGGDLQKLGNGIFLCAPNNVSVEGKMTGNAEEKAQGAKNTTEEKDSEYDW